MAELSEAAREAQRDYMREWRKKNQARVREKNQRYWERKAAERKEKIENAEKSAD